VVEYVSGLNKKSPLPKAGGFSINACFKFTLLPHPRAGSFSSSCSFKCECWRERPARAVYFFASGTLFF
jgi:hypothetical protein